MWNMEASAMAAEERAGEELGGSSVSFVLGTPAAAPAAAAALGAGTPTGGGMAAPLPPLLGPLLPAATAPVVW